jgi:hypothetical protein
MTMQTAINRFGSAVKTYEKKFLPEELDHHSPFLAILIIACLVDDTITWYGLTFTPAWEANPFVSSLMDMVGVVPAAIMSTIWSVAVTFIAAQVAVDFFTDRDGTKWDWLRSKRKIAFIIYALPIATSTFAVVNNVYILTFVV